MTPPTDDHDRGASPVPKVRLVVLNFNGGEHTQRALRHLTELDWPADRLQLVCVDNGSTDGSAEEAERRFPQVEVRRLGANTGFPGNNRALEDLDGVDYVGLVNNDAFVEPGWLAPLVEALVDDRGLGAASSKMVLAPRFAEVAVDAPAFSPGPADPRQLGVMVRAVSVGGEDVSRHAHLGRGGWGKEHDRQGSFEWTAPSAALRVPCPEGAVPPFDATLVLQSRRPVTVTLDGGEGPTTAEVGPTPHPGGRQGVRRALRRAQQRRVGGLRGRCRGRPGVARARPRPSTTRRRRCSPGAAAACSSGPSTSPTWASSTSASSSTTRTRTSPGGDGRGAGATAPRPPPSPGTSMPPAAARAPSCSRSTWSATAS